MPAPGSARLARTVHDGRRTEPQRRHRKGEPVADGRPVESTPLNHPVLGPSLSIYSDRRQALAGLFLDLAFLCVALVGFLLGAGDLTGSNPQNAGFTLPPILGLAQILAAFVVAGWAIRAGWHAVGRIRNPASVIVGRDGFQFQAGDGPVSWDEVDSIGDFRYPDDQPRSLRVQLSDPAEYAKRHSLSPVGLVIARLNRGELALGHDTIMPIDALQALMRKRLAEFNGEGPAAKKAVPAASSNRPAKRRHVPKR
jgi:hypothetical protein